MKNNDIYKYWSKFAVSALVNAGLYVAYRLYVHHLEHKDDKKEDEITKNTERSPLEKKPYKGPKKVLLMEKNKVSPKKKTTSKSTPVVKKVVTKK